MTFDPRPFIEHYRAENEAERRAIKERAATALTEARRIAELIRDKDSDVRAVILFGSLAEGGPNRKDFDIDLAIVGGDVFKAMDAADDSAFKVDIVSLERLPADVRDRIAKKGIELAAT